MYKFLTNFLTMSSFETVKELDVDMYLGKWYQIYGTPSNILFQGYGKCITAEYGLLDNDYLSVLNQQINKSGDLESIDGYAYIENESEPGKLMVHLNGTSFDAPYWIIELGNVENNQYQFSIVTNPLGTSMWTLVRDLENYDDNEIIQYLDDYEFNYVPIYQQNC